MDTGATEGNAVDQFVELDPTELAAVRRIAKEQGVELDEVKQMGLEPVTTVTVVVTGTVAAVGLVIHLIEGGRGGQVIDLTGAMPAFRRDKNLLYGLVVVLLRNGKVKIAVKEPRGLLGQALDTLKGIVGDLTKQSLDSAAKTVKESLGAMATVTAEP